MIKRQRNTLFTTLALLFGMALAGCGGGGGGGGSSSAPTGVSLSGSVVKGQLRYGLVSVYEIINGVPGGTPLISGETDASGKYSLTVPAGHTGPFKVVVSKGPNSVMLCDATPSCNGVPFGSAIPNDQLPNLRLTALVPSKSAGATVPVNVTPLTHMASSYAESLGLNSDTIQAANSKVGALFEVTDLTGTNPVDITDTAAVKAAGNANGVRLALFSAALAQLAESRGVSVAALLEELADGYANNDGQLNTQATLGEVSLSELLANADTIRNKLKTDDPQSIGSDVDSTFTNLTTTSNTLAKTNTPITLPTPGTGLAATKALMAKTRTYWQGVLAPLSLQQSAATAFNSQINLAQRAGALVNTNYNTYQRVIAAASAYATNSPGLSPLGSCGSNHELESIPALTGIDPGITGCLEFSGSKIGLLAGLPLTITLNATLGNTTTLSFTATATLINSMKTLKLQLTDGTIIQPGVYTSRFSNGLVNLNFVEAVSLATVDNLRLASVTSSLNVNLDEDAGHAADPISFNGTMSLDSLFEGVTGWYDVQYQQDPITGQTTVVNTPYPDEMPKPRNLSLNGTVSNTTGDSYQVSAIIKLTNAATFRLSDILPVDHPVAAGGRYLFSADGNSVAFTWMDQWRTTITYNPTTQNGRVETYQNSLNGWQMQPGGFELTGPYANMHELMLQNVWFMGHLTTWIENHGYYKLNIAPGGPVTFNEQTFTLTLPTSLAGVTGQLNGILWEPDWYFGNMHDYYFNTPDNYMLGELTLSFGVNLNALPPLTLTLSGKSTGMNAGTGTVTIAFDSRRLEMSVSGDNSGGGTSLKVTDETGATLVIANSDNQQTGALSMDGVVYGVIFTSPSTGAEMIRYADGTLETLF